MTRPAHSGAPDWEAFYRSYRKPGYVAGYEITSKLGGGMFGLVFKAQKQSIGKDYAIKFLKVDDDEVRQAIAAELDSVKYFAQVDHPNLVSIEDRGEVDGIPYIVMAYAGADTLRDRMNAPEADRDELVRLLLQACRGVQALHERSLVHFDLKPANVFLKGDVARVGDYGLSKLVAHSRNTLSMGRGTPYYMAPEMLQRKGDARSDVYSLGVILFECLTGEVPFKGDSEWEVLRKHENETPRYPVGLAPVYRTVLDRCLQKDPKNRFATVGELVDSLQVARAPAAAARPAAAPLLSSGVPVPPIPTVPPVPPIPRQVRPGPTRVSAEAAAEAAAFIAEAYNVPRRAAQRARRTQFRRFAGVMVLLLLFVGVTFTFSGMRRAKNFRAQAQRRSQVAVSAVEELGIRGPLRVQLTHWKREAGLKVRLALSGSLDQEPNLRNIDYPEAHPAWTLDFYKDQLEPFAEESSFSKGHAHKLESQGYLMVLAAVDYLQDLDYDDDCELRQASRVGRLLQQMTGIEALDVKEPRGRIRERDRRANGWAARYWRDMVERFCSDEKEFGELLRATGKRAEAPIGRSRARSRG